MMQSKQLLLIILSIFIQLAYLVKGQSNGEIRLNSWQKESDSAGRLEIFLNNSWGTVCENGFRMKEANVVCHQLGFIGSEKFGNAVALGYSYGVNAQIIALDKISCMEDDLHVLSCSYNTTNNCNHFQDVAVVCDRTKLWSVSPYNGQIRLVEGRYVSQGKLEVYCNGQWGTVCDDLFEIDEANTVCQHLGYTNAVSFSQFGPYGNNTNQPIWLDNVRCSSVQSCLSLCQMCPEKEWHDCVHAEDITIQCTYNNSFISSPSQLYYCKYVFSGAISNVMLAIIIITCTAVGCCCFFVLIAVIICFSVSIVKKHKTSNEPSTAYMNNETIYSEVSDVNNIQQCQVQTTPVGTPMLPPRRPIDSSTTSVFTFPNEMLQGFPNEILQELSTNDQPVYITSDNGKVIYIQPPQHTPPFDLSYSSQ